MRVLVTGGAGFIGSCFVKYILNKYSNYELINLDALTYCGNLDNLKEIENNSNYHFIKGNICDSKLVKEITKDVDFIVNFAAESHVDNSIKNPQIFIETNVKGTMNLLEAAKENHIKRFLQVSTDEVYGSLGSEGYFYETTPLAPNSPYSASKASADLLVRAYYETYKLPVVITRCSNNYGPYHFPEKLIPLIIKKALANEQLPIYGNGQNVRDWLHVYDHCTAIDLIVRKGRNGEVYNIGGHNEKTTLEVVKTILKELGKPESLITYVKDRAGHDLRYAIDPSKLMNELGWKPKYTFETGIGPTIQWNLENQEWIKNIESGEYLKWMERYK